MKKGKKYDNGKLMYHLLPFRELDSVVRVLTFGMKKYGEDDWKKFVLRDDNEKRYMSACLRHISEYSQRKTNDNETGEQHISHAICCLLFVLWKENEKSCRLTRRNSISRKQKKGR